MYMRWTRVGELLWDFSGQGNKRVRLSEDENGVRSFSPTYRGTSDEFFPVRPFVDIGRKAYVRQGVE